MGARNAEEVREKQCIRMAKYVCPKLALPLLNCIPKLLKEDQHGFGSKSKDSGEGARVVDSLPSQVSPCFLAAAHTLTCAIRNSKHLACMDKIRRVKKGKNVGKAVPMDYSAQRDLFEGAELHRWLQAIPAHLKNGKAKISITTQV